MQRMTHLRITKVQLISSIREEIKGTTQDNMKKRSRRKHEESDEQKGFGEDGGSSHGPTRPIMLAYCYNLSMVPHLSF